MILLLLFLLLCASPAWAQKTCTPTTATAQTCTVTLTWTAPVVDATHGAATSYIIRRADGTGAMTQIGTTTTALTLQNTFTDAGNIAHCWEVAGVNAGGTGPATPRACWTSPGIAVLPPNAPSGSTLAAISSTQLQASWRDNSDNEERFKLVTTGFNPPSTLINYATANANNFTISGLQRNKTYCNKVSAMLSIFESMPDVEQCATTRK